jgi:hypothetical protein
MFEEGEQMWNQLFITAEGRDWGATDPNVGGPKLKRVTRVLLAAKVSNYIKKFSHNF